VKVLLTNDDGIDAPGLAALEASLPPDFDYLVLAPDGQRSECSHTVTTRHSLRLIQLSGNRWSLNGSPVDCVRVALTVLAPNLAGVLSGVNDGGNLGADIYISGTAAAAREAAIHGLPAIAISQYRNPSNPRTWDHITRWLGGRLVPLLEEKSSKAGFWNINLPSISDSSGHPPELVRTTMCRHPMPLGYTREGELLTYRVDYHSRPKNPGTDITECFGGKISVSRIAL
jgi:5'-nucleotidase